MSGGVSVIIPVFNGERFVQEAIGSALAQSAPPLEVIVVDDGSTDGTAHVARACGGTKTHYASQANAGPQVARNHGVRLARGAFIAFLDADDIWESHKLERQLEHFAEVPSLDCSLARARLFWERGLEAEEARHRTTAALEVAGVCWSAMLVRRSLLERVGPFNPDLKHTDAADWFERARASGAHVDALDDVLLRRRMHAASFSRESRVNVREEWLTFAAKALQRRRQEGGGE